MLLLVTALVIFNFLEAILKSSLPTPLPAMARAKIAPSTLRGLPNSQCNDLRDVYVKWGMPRGEKIADTKGDTVYYCISAEHNPSSGRNFLSPAQFSQWLSYFFAKLNKSYKKKKPERFMEQQGMGIVAQSSPSLFLRKKPHPCTSSPSHASKTI